MLFCGQCGLQLAPGSSTCPRCGMVTQPELPREDLHLEDPTIASDPRLPLQSPYSPQNPQYPQASRPPQSPTPHYQGNTPLPPLVLRQDGSNPENAGQFSSKPTRPTNDERFSEPSPYSTIDMRYQSSPPPVGTDYAAQRASNPGFSQPGNVNYPVSAPGFAQDIPVTPPLPEPRRGRGGVIALFVVLIVLLLAIGTAAIIIKPAFLFGSAATPTPTATTVTMTSGPTAAQQAQAVVQQYYTDINNKDYQSAYNLWITPQCAQNPCTYTDFATGFANTIRDTVTITNTTLLSNGSVKVSITLNAQETTKNNIYHGYYTIGQLNGKWLIVNGVLG